MKKKPTLIIIDMQYDFESALDEDTIGAVLNSIEDAIKREFPIIIVEYHDCGHTLDCIIDAVGDYNKTYFVEKRKDDGGGEINDTVFAQNLKVSEYLVCGVNLSFCVKETVDTLIWEYDRKVSIIKNACFCATIMDKRQLNRESILNKYSIFKKCSMIG